MYEQSPLDDARDDRPPICPACGVTMGILDEGEATRYACLECGFSDETNPHSIAGERPGDIERS